MKLRFTLALLLFTFFAFHINAQVIWGGPGDPNGEFDGGLNDWTVVAVSSAAEDSVQNARWVWDEDGSGDNGAYWGDRPAIESPSVSNGVAIFNSDFLDNDGTQGNFGGGLAPSPQKSELISPMIDCSDRETVVISFYQDFRRFQGSTSIEVSTDGGNSYTSYTINGEDETKTFVNDNLPFAESFYRLNITEQAAGMDSVMFKFVWDGDYYYWIIDDVAVIEQPDNDLKVGDIFYSPGNTLTPVSQLDVVEFDFAMDIQNLGRMPQTDIEVEVSILDTDLNPLFEYAMMFDSIGANDTVTVEFDTLVNPLETAFAEPGDYILQYSILDEDISPRDNRKRVPFTFSDGTFSKDYQDFQYWSFSNFWTGNYYRTGSWEGSGNGAFLATKMFISATDGGSTNGGMTNLELGGAVFKVNDDVAEDFSNFDVNADLTVVADHPNLTPVGYIVASLQAADRGIFEIDLIDFDSDELGVMLEPNSRYFFMIEDKDPETSKFFGFERYIDFFQVSSLVYVPGDQLYFGGFGADFSFGGSVEIGFVSNTEEQTLDEDIAELNVFPNPATENYQLKLNFSQATDATIILTGIDGKVHRMENFKSVTRMDKVYNTDNLDSGTYILRALTDEGQLNSKLVINK